MLVADVPVKSGEEVECLCANNVLTVRLVESVRWAIILLVVFNHGICHIGVKDISKGVTSLIKDLFLKSLSCIRTCNRVIYVRVLLLVVLAAYKDEGLILNYRRTKCNTIGCGELL